MKKKIVGRLGVVALALTLVTTCLMGGTLAKYTVDVTGTATATVAKFAFNLNGATKASDTINIDNLFKSAYGAGNEVKATSKVVAPGTSGKVEIKLENTGEVAIKPTFKIEETNANTIPLQYAVTTTDAEPAAGEWKAATDLKPALDAVAVGGAAKTFYLHWKWNTATDTADTALGTADTAAKVELKITCTVEQAALTAPAA